MAHRPSTEASSDAVLDTTHSDSIHAFPRPDLHIRLAAKLASIDQELQEAQARLRDVMDASISASSDVEIFDSDLEGDSDNEELPLPMLPKRNSDFLAMMNDVLRGHRNVVDMAHEVLGTFPPSDVDLEKGCDVKGKGKGKAQVSESKKRCLSNDEDYGRRPNWLPFSRDYRTQPWPLRENSSRKYFTGDPSGSWQRRREDNSINLLNALK